MAHPYHENRWREKLSHIMLMKILVWDKNRVITVAIIIGLFGGLIGGPIASLIYYGSTPEERFYVFIIPEIVGFICAGLMIYVTKLKKKKSNVLS
jgi:hypothetical protein